MGRIHPSALLLLLSACTHPIVGWTDFDRTAPQVRSTTPADGAVQVAPNAAISATFTEDMEPSTLREGTFTLGQGPDAVSGVVSYVGVTALFTPDERLERSRTYTGVVFGEVEDLSGNPMGQDFTWSFSVGELDDVTAPQVIDTSPPSNAVEVAPDAVLVATFSEEMHPGSVTAGRGVHRT
jgi:hypothetical protein